MRVCLLIACLVFTSWLANGPALARLPAAVDGQALPSLAPLLEEVTPAVVNINTARRVRVQSPLMADPLFRFFFDQPGAQRERISRSLGSGVVIDSEQGHILTNNHVIEGADEISVTLHDGRTLAGEVIGTDPDSDIALIRVEADNLSGLPLGESEQLRVGDFVLAVGNPFGLGQSVSSGIVSALGRTGLSGVNYQNFIQTDAPINPGNSGGALVNLRGELVGINTAIFSPSGGNVGIGFAIPTQVAMQVMQELLEHGVVRRGTISVELQTASAQLAEALGLSHRHGVIVTHVDSASDTARAGLRTGDMILSIQGHRVVNADDVRNHVGLAAPGEPLQLQVLRDGQQLSLQAPLSQPPLQSLQGGAVSARLEGATLQSQVQRSQRRGAVTRIIVSQIEPGSPAWQYGLRAQDIVLGLNQRPLDSLEDLQQAFARGDGAFYLNVLRDRQSLLIAFR